jgi:hypothetical protein
MNSLLFDPDAGNLWTIEAEVDLDAWHGVPLVAVTEIGSSTHATIRFIARLAVIGVD